MRCLGSFGAAHALVIGFLITLSLSGCGSRPGGNGGSSSSTALPQASAGAEEDFSPVVDVDLSTFDLENIPELSPIIDPETFEPPTLEELKASKTWVDKPVVDPFDRVREYKATLPDATAGALSLKNDSADANTQLISAYGRLPESDDEVDYDAELTLMVPNDAKSVNPILISSKVAMEVTGLTGFGIFGFDRVFNPFALADVTVSWQASEDQSVDLVVLRDDLTWSDGTPITAYDVEFSFDTIMDPEVPVPAVRAGTDEIADVVAYDDHTVAYFHKQPLATNVWNVNFPVIPKHIYEKTVAEDKTMATSDRHVELERKPLSGNAYEIASRKRGQEIVLQRRESYYMHEGKQVRRKPYFKTIRFKIIADPNTALLALKSGEIDYMLLTPPQWENQTSDDAFYKTNTKLYGQEWGFSYIGWNIQTPFFNDVKTRRAMSYAINWDAVINDICYGLYKQGQGIYAADAWMAPDPMPQPYVQDLDRAEELLAEAGWEDHDDDGFLDKEVNGKTVKFDFSLLYASGSKIGERIAVLVKENLDQIGIVCNVKPTEFTVLQQRNREHDFDATLAAWGTGADPDTSTNLWTTPAIDAGRNYVCFSDPTVDKLFELGKREADREKRGRIYATIHKTLWNAQPYTWLYYRSTFVGMSKELRGITFAPREPFGFSGGLEGLWKPK